MAARTVRLVAFDLDGTILDPAGRPSPSALAAIRQLLDRGVALASISGRSIRRSLQPFTDCADLTRRMHVCGYNGAVGTGPAADGRRPLLFAHRLSGKALGELVDYTCEQDLNLVYCRCEVGPEGLVEEYRFLHSTGGQEAAIDWSGEGYRRDARLIERIRTGELGPPPKIMLFTEASQHDRTMAALRERLCGQIYIAWAVRTLLEIMPQEADKGAALQALCEATGVPLEETLAIGDGNNDLPMLRQAGAGVLMGNAEPETRAAVENTGVRLARPFAEDGFARAVREYVPFASSC